MDTKLLGLILQGDKKNEREFTRIKETYEELSKSKANTITSSANGESIVLSDSSDSKLDSLRVMGKTEQFTTTGKNLLPNNAVTTTVNGVTFTVNDDGSIAVNGTASKQCSCRIYEGAFGDNCILSGCPSGSQYGELYRLQTVNYRKDGANDVWTVLARDEGTGAIIDTTQFNTGYVEIVITNGTTVSNLTFYPMIRLASITDPSYEPYTGGIPSPNPQYPQEIVSAGDDEDIEVGVYGGNLIPSPYTESTTTSGGLIYEALSDGSIKVTGTKTGTSFFNLVGSIVSGYNVEKISFKQHVYASVENAFRLATRLTDGTYVHAFGDSILDKSIGALYVECMAANNTVVNEIIHPLISYVPNAEWTPYHKQPLTIQTPNGLPGIKVTDPSIATYTDEAGQMWCADEVDFERGVYVKRVIAESRTKVNAFIGSDKSYFFIVLNNAVSTKQIFYCNVAAHKAKNMDFGNAWIAGDGRLIIGNLDESGNPVYATTDELFNGIDKIEFIDMLATPIETPLSESELEAYKTLHTNYPTTTILNDSGAHMDVKYTADKKNYIDNKFAQITNAVLSMGSNI